MSRTFLILAELSTPERTMRESLHDTRALRRRPPDPPTSGRDVRDDRSGIPSYEYERASADCTIAVWIERRFKRSLPGFDVQMLKDDGSVADHRTRLSTLRGTYRT